MQQILDTYNFTDGWFYVDSVTFEDSDTNPAKARHKIFAINCYNIFCWYW